VTQLAVDADRHAGVPAAAALLRHQLAVLLLRLSLLPDTAGRPASRAETDTFHRLCREVERGYQHTRRVEDYAARLGCSVRTLTRACLAVTGRSAKQVIDERVALQASRLLAATDEPIARIGRWLGFPEPTNFGRFFTREVGVSPGAFRSVRERPIPVRMVRPRPPADSPAGPGRA
jgi:AraC-like DNA-binding protein